MTLSLARLVEKLKAMDFVTWATQSIRLTEAERDALIAAVPAWMPIETAPKDGASVLLWAPESIQTDTGPKPFIHVSRWVLETWDRWEDAGPVTRRLVVEDASHWQSYEDPTHWMPLPMPPAEGDLP